MSEETDDERVVRSLDELKALIGQEISAGQWIELTQAHVDDFVESTSAWQGDPAAADGTTQITAGTVVPGLFLLSAGAILGEGRRGITIELGGRLSVNYGMNRVRWPMPVHVGQRVRTRTTLLNVEELERGAIQMTRLTTIDIDGETEPACVAETLGRIYF